MNRKYKVAYVSGSRADYGIVRRYLNYLKKDEQIDFSILVTGSHLEDAYGKSVENIREDGFVIEAEIPLSIHNSSNAEVLHSMAIGLDAFGEYFERHKYDLLIVLGDRYEIFAAAIAASIQKIPMLHLHGGETTYGNYDEFIRHSITKMSYYHFTSTQEYRKRVIQLGEAPERVFYMGALGAENCINIHLEKVEEKVLQLPEKQYFVIVFHPETLTGNSVRQQMEELLRGLESFPHRTEYVFMGTNADTQSDVIRREWIKYVEEHPNVHYIENMNADSFLYMVQHAIALIGNSSSGIIEAPSLGVYTINIGMRQAGRVRGGSVLDIACDAQELCNAMTTVYEQARHKLTFQNPYYLPDTANRYYIKTKELLALPVDSCKEFYDCD